MNVDEIIVDDRQRRDVGDLDALIESIRRIGLLHPIVVGTDNRLKVGYRRLMAYKKAGWKDIPATVTDRLDDIVLALEAERDENIPERTSNFQEIFLKVGGRPATGSRPRSVSRAGPTRKPKRWWRLPRTSPTNTVP